MTKHLWTFILITGYLWTNVASGQSPTQDEDQNIDQTLMPEFCVASFLVTGNAYEADIWLKNYDLDRVAIAFIQHNLEVLIKSNEIRGEDVIAAVDGCKDARQSEESNDE